MNFKSILLTAVATLGLITSVVAQPQWTQLSNFPAGRAGHNFFSIGNKGYLIGGNNGTLILNTVFEYNSTTNIWTQLAPMTISRAQGVAFTINGIGYVTLGGSNSMHAFNPITNTWQSKANFPSLDRTGSVAFVIGNNAYVGLGKDINGNTYSDFYKYNSISDTWSNVASFPNNRTDAAAFVINGKAYVGTGLINWNTPLQSDLYEYNPITNIWIQKTSIPGIGRYAAIGFSMNGKGYIGTGEKVNPTGLLSDILEYDVVNNSWNSYSTYPGGGVNYAELFIINNIVFIGGGSPGWRSDFYKISSCSHNTLITPQINSLSIGNTAFFSATTSDPNPNYIWQSDFGQGFQTLNNIGNYSGANTGSLNIANVQLSEHNQPIRVISTSGNCIDTSNVAVINILDTCLVTVYDTLLTTVTDTLVINTQITGINPPNSLNTLKVFPNPASTHITIDYGNFNAMSGYTLKIVNAVGQTVFTTPINQQTSYIDLSTWTGNGIYFVQLIDPQNNTIENRKILIQ